MDVLRHRVAVTYEAEAEEKTSETIVQKIFDELAGAVNQSMPTLFIEGYKFRFYSFGCT